MAVVLPIPEPSSFQSWNRSLQGAYRKGALAHLNGAELADCPYQEVKIEREKLEQVGEYLRGSSKSVGDAIQAFELGDDVDESQLEGDLLDVETELCVHCNWWHEVCELQYSEENGGGLCEQCCDELGVEFE